MSSLASFGKGAEDSPMLRASQALIYLVSRSVWNWIRMQVRRARQPKYLLGAIAAVAYLGFFFVGPAFAARKSGPMPLQAPEFRAIVELMAALILAMLMVAAWIIPKKRAALDFSEAEIAFLFPSPLSRQALIHFKLIKSLLAIGLTATLMALLTHARFSSGNVLMPLLAWGLGLGIVQLHDMGASFVRTWLLDRGVTHAVRRFAVFLMIVVAIAITLLPQASSLPRADWETLGTIQDFAEYIHQLHAHGLVFFCLLPFEMIVRPFFVSAPSEFVLSIAPVLCVFALHYLWVVRSQVSFEEATIEQARRKAELIAAVQGGNWHLAQGRRKAKRAPFELAPQGSGAVAFFWKNLLAGSEMFNPKFWGTFAIGYVGILIIFQMLAPDSPILKMLGALPLGLLPVLVFAGPFLLPLDFRQDLKMADLLKTFPVSGWQIALGQLIAPALILTMVEWFLLFVNGLLLPQFPGMKLSPILGRVSYVLSVAMIFPFLNLISLLVVNTATLLFPAWMPSAQRGPRGMEAMGQQIIFSFIQLFSLALALLPAAGIGLLVFFVGRGIVGPVVIAPIASAAAVCVLCIEIGVGVKMLGDLWERHDLSLEEQST
jgi:ABC-2 type transport system permease protein